MSAPVWWVCGLCTLIATLAVGARLHPAPERTQALPHRQCEADDWSLLLPPRGRRARRIHRAAVDASYPDALELVVLCLRAGHLPAEAVAAAMPHLPAALAPSFGAVLRQVHQGARFADALSELPRLLGPVAQPLADSFAAADRYGLPLAPIVERLAADARQQRRRHTEARARQLPVRLAAPLVLCTLPSFVLLAVVPLLLAALGALAR